MDTALLESRLNTRPLRLKAVWILVLPFLWFASPDGSSMVVGAATGVLGLLARAWAAGSIHKERALATAGPYAYTRNPLYIGSLLLGVGITYAGGGLLWMGLFLAFYLVVYTRTMSGEEELLEAVFGEPYRHYRENVPAFVPRVSAYRAPGGEMAVDGGATSTEPAPTGFTLARYLHNKEWEALLGFAAAFLYFAARWWLAGGGAA